MLSDIIFKRDTVGNVRTWQYEVDGDRYRTIAGLKDGAKVESGWTVCAPKSQDTAEAQALFEARAAEIYKLDRGYHRLFGDIDKPLYFAPMLAQTFRKAEFPVFAQPKLDGIRCIATSRGLFSRSGKQIFGVPHIEESLTPYFEADPALIFDGELYNHDLKDDFNTIASVVRKQKPNDEELARSRLLIKYHVYDMPSHPGTFRERFSALRNLDPNPDPSLGLVIVDTIRVDSINELDDELAEWLARGYEGQMIRLDAPYEQKRSKTLLKRKEFQDSEFELVDIQEGLGNWAGYGKKVVCRLPDGREFGAGVKGNQEFARGLLERRENLIGGQVTVRYFALTPDGVPRFPVAVDFHAQGRAD